MSTIEAYPEQYRRISQKLSKLSFDKDKEVNGKQNQEGGNGSAIEIVDQLLEGGSATRDQLLHVRTQLSISSQEWLEEIEEGWLKESLMQLALAKVPQQLPQVRSLPRGTTPAVCLAPRLRMAFCKTLCWDMPVWEIDRQTDGKPLSASVLWICEDLELYDGLCLNPASMKRFALAIEQMYNNNPYHSKYHAATVTLSMYQIMTHSGLFHREQAAQHQGFPLRLYALAAVLAACVHDVNHPGVGNDFRVRSNDTAAMMYHDISVNENDHLHNAFKVIRDTQVLAGLSEEAYRLVRAVIVDIVLKTDMTAHFDVVSKFMSLQHEDIMQHDVMLASLAMFLKCADLAHCTFVWPDHVYWVKMLQEEFHRQGDLEKQFDFSGSPLTCRKGSLGPTQAKFFEALIIPMYKELASVYPETKTLLDRAVGNHEKWIANGGVIPDIDLQAPNGAKSAKSSNGRKSIAKPNLPALRAVTEH